MGGDEQKFVQEAFDTNWIAPLGPNVNNFEKDLSTFLSTDKEDNIYTAALTSGTGALHLALILLGVEAGDEVLCQSFTFSASANPIVYQGATPVFIDSETDTWNMDPVLLEEAIKDRISKGKKPKAIIVAHLYGMPAKMNEINSIAATYNIAVIEDAAEALGSSIDGKMCGNFSKFGILSFNGNKIITTSGGGALVSSDEEMINKSRFLATQARDDAPHYQHSHIGYNYRMSNIVAGIGRGQMMVLPERVKQRRANCERYKNYFYNIAERGYNIKIQSEPKGYYSNYWLTSILIEPSENKGITREDLRLSLEKENIECRPLWKPMHLQPVFESAPYYCNGTSEHLFNIGLCLPSGSNLTDEDFGRIFSAMDKVFK